jgi:hypothetical protein
VDRYLGCGYEAAPLLRVADTAHDFLCNAVTLSFAQKVSKPVREAVSEPEAVATGSTVIKKAQHYTITDNALSSVVTRSLPLPVLIPA